MNPIVRTFARFDDRPSDALALVRIFLGMALLVRGVLILADPGVITRLSGAHQYYAWYSLVVVLHVAGGLCLTVGLWTRLAALVQIPVLAGAVLLVHRTEGLGSGGQSLELSALVLFLLCVLAVFGPGAMSLDRRSARSSAQEEPA